MGRRYYPALRGLFGDWVYYSCLMPMKEVTERLKFADEIHKSKNLSELIQRELKKGHSKEIASYLLREDQRFFNSLVVAIYGGDAAWHGFSNFKPQVHDIKLEDIPSDVEDSVGFLSFTGEEKIFAIDGQHRLAGMTEAIKNKPELGTEDVSLVLVAHQSTVAGQERSRRLFTTLNKTAIAVGKGEIIALDENDVMAIMTRHLVENDQRFSEGRIQFVQSDSLPNGSQSLTTIGNLYDILGIIFRKFGFSTKRADLRFVRPSDEELAKYMALSKEYFDSLGKAFPPLGEYFSASSAKAKTVVSKYRLDNGGHVLFRPVGLKLFAEIAVALAKNQSTPKEAIRLMAKLPVDLAAVPYRGVIWLPNGRMYPAGRAICRRLLLHMLGMESRPDDLKARYAKLLEKDVTKVKLPAKIV